MFSNRTWLFLLFCSLTIASQGQVIQKAVPDGTEGEVHPDPDSTKKERWRLFKGKYSSLKLGGGFLYEFAGYSQDNAARQQMDSAGVTLEPAFKVRDFRLVASGQLKTKRSIGWKVGLMYDGTSNSWLVRETGIMIGIPELKGHIFIGRTKEGFSLNKVMNGYAGWTMERQMAIDLIPILADGVKLLGFDPKSRVLWNVGIYNDAVSKGQSFSTYAWQFASRVGWLPVHSEATKTLVHVGINYRYGRTLNDQIQVRSRPEANPAPYFIDTGKMPATHSTHWGGEIYLTKGSLMLGSEFYIHQFNAPTAGNPVFHGGDVVASYILTGESRPYNTTSGIYGFVPVAKPVFSGGPGVWEVLLRYSTLDLDGGTVHGGKFWRITPMVNWYLSSNVRLEVAYGYGVLDRYSLTGATHFFQTRIQFTVL